MYVFFNHHWLIVLMLMNTLFSWMRAIIFIMFIVYVNATEAIKSKTITKDCPVK